MFTCFAEETRGGGLKGDKWDAINYRIACVTEEFMEEEDLDDFGLDVAQQCLNEKRKKIEKIKTLAPM